MSNDTPSGYKLRYIDTSILSEGKERTTLIPADSVAVDGGLVRFQVDGRDVYTLRADRVVEYERFEGDAWESECEGRANAMQMIADSVFGGDEDD